MLLQVISYEDDNIDRFFKYYNIISWGVPSVIVVILVLRHVWFNVLCESTTLGEFGIVRISFFIPLAVSWIYNVFSFIKLSRKLFKEQTLHSSMTRFVSEAGTVYTSENDTPGIVRTHRLFLVAFAVCWIWGILLAFLEFFGVDNIGWLVNLNYISTPLPGLYNSIIYGMNDALRAKIAAVFNEYSCCRKINLAPEEDVNEALVTHKYDNEEFLQWRTDSHSNFASVQ